MRLTFPILTLCIGGAQRMLAEVTNGLVKKGHNVTILMPPQGEVAYPILAKLRRTPFDSIRTEDYPPSDIIVSNFYLTVPSAIEASKRGKGVHVRFSLCYEPTFLPDNHITFPTYHQTKNLIVLSRWQQKIIDLNHGIQGHIVPVGISSAFRNWYQRSWHSPLQVTAIIRNTEGIWSWHREQPYLFDQLHFVMTARPQIVVNLICPANELAKSPSLLHLKDSGRFVFHSPDNDEDLCKVYNGTDIFVSASTYDSASIPGLEAMKCGAAHVATYAGGNVDYCRHEENCLLSYRYQNRLGQDILRLIDDEALRRTLAASGELEAAKWTWEASVNQFEAVMNSLHNQNP